MSFIKKIIIITFLAFVCCDAYAQNRIYKFKSYKIPHSEVPFTSFYVNEANQIFLPLNGGIFLVKDSLWFIPPSIGYYFTSFAPNIKENALFVLANKADSTELYYLKSNKNAPIQRASLAKIDNGLYNLIFKSGICYVWGFNSNTSRIGILSEQGINWVFKVQGIIKQVQINKSGEIFFSLGNTIYQLSNQKKVLILNSKIGGFDFNERGQLVVSFKDGVGVQNEDAIEIVATGVTGTVQCINKNIYVLPSNGGSVYQIFEAN